MDDRRISALDRLTLAKAGTDLKASDAKEDAHLITFLTASSRMGWFRTSSGVEVSMDFGLKQTRDSTAAFICGSGVPRRALLRLVRVVR